jgi:hypothetical protein
MPYRARFANASLQEFWIPHEINSTSKEDSGIAAIP